MRALVLGGTAFLGRAIAAAAVREGWDVVCLARGSAPVQDGARLVTSDRDADDGLAPVREQEWDVVVDVTRQPGHCRRAVRDLRAGHWVLISTGNVYARFDRPEQGEDADLVGPLAEDVLDDPAQYGSAKVACEQAVQRSCDSWTVIRSGLIGGAGDRSGRSGYYPWRFAHPTGSDVLVPPDLSFPTAMIDVADLADWTVECARRRVHGVFNATGPTTTLGEVLETARAVAGSASVVRPVPAVTMAKAEVQHWMGPASLPLWIDDPGWRFFATMDTTAARAQGLRTRPLAQTLAAALDYEEHHRQEPRQAGLSDDDEQRLRAMLT